jgi:3-deoxy-D-manno-octulosonic-acid transferase
MYRLYRTATTLLSPLLPLWLARRAKRGKEDIARLEERYGMSDALVPAAPIVWLHAASVGEAQSVLPLIDALHAALPTHHMLITTGTRTSAALIASHSKPYLTHQYVPLDVSRYVQRFLARWRPHLAVWVESEFWPVLLMETSHRHIPMLLVNARISDKSYRRWRRFRTTATRLLTCFDAIFAGSEEDAARLRSLGALDVRIAGNLKFDASALRADSNALATLKQQIGARPVWVAASTHEGEEAMVVAAHQRLKLSYPNLLTILVPRHAARGDEIAALLRTQNMAFARRSLLEPITAGHEIYLADTMGELGTLYACAPISFVGGSLMPHGGHNPLEPARLHCAILSGSHTHNFAPIFEAMQAADAVRIVRDAHALAWEVELLFGDAARTAQLAQNAKQFAASQSGATESIVASAITLLGEGGA